MAKRPRTRRAANPINPRGIPRGPAKTAVYRDLARLAEDQTTAWERATLRYENGESDKPYVDLLAEEVGRPEPLRLRHRERATLLITRLSGLGYATRRKGDAVLRELNSEAIADAKELAGERERERDELLLAQWWSADAEERAALDDLRFIWGVAMREFGSANPQPFFTPYDQAKGIATQRFKQAHGRPPRVIPHRLDVQVDRVLRKRRDLAARQEREYRKQLANLPILDARHRDLTIADWIRNIRRLARR
jgi:hypothetical protein